MLDGEIGSLCNQVASINEKHYIVVYQDANFDLVLDYLTATELNNKIPDWKRTDSRVAIIEDGSVVKGFYSSWTLLSHITTNLK